MPEITIPALKMALNVNDEQISGHALMQFRTVAQMLNHRIIKCQRLQVENQRLSTELALFNAAELEAERRTNAVLTQDIERLESEIEALKSRRGADWLAS